jgi:hypothetical protein
LGHFCPGLGVISDSGDVGQSRPNQNTPPMHNIAGSQTHGTQNGYRLNNQLYASTAALQVASLCMILQTLYNIGSEYSCSPISSPDWRRLAVM